MSVNAFPVVSSGAALPEGAKKLITQGFSSKSFYTYTPATPLPAGNYMLTANPCETVYAQFNGRDFKSDDGKIAFSTTEPITSITFKADQKFSPDDADIIQVPNELGYVSPAGMTDSANFRLLGESKGVFYALSGGSSNNLMRSLDMVHWEQTNEVMSGQHEEFATRDRLFTVNGTTYIIGSSMTLTTTNNGVTWSAFTHNLGGYSVAYGNGTFVAMGGNGAQTYPYTSTNGVSWTQRALIDSSYAMNSVIYAGGQFVATGYGRVYTSPDGITWTQRTTTAGSSGTPTYCLAYNGSLYMLINSTNVYTSPNAITWTSKGSWGAGDARSLVWFNGYFAATAAGITNTYRYTTDGTTWTSVSPTSWGKHTLNQWRYFMINEAGTKIFATGQTTSGTSYNFYGISTDLVNWTKWGGSSASQIDFNVGRAAKVGNDLYFSDRYDLYKTSDYGRTWSAWSITTSNVQEIYTLSYANDRFFAVTQRVGVTYGAFAYSIDGLNWVYGSTEILSNGIPQNTFSKDGYTFFFTNGPWIYRLSSNGVVKRFSASTFGALIGYYNGYIFWISNNSIYWGEFESATSGPVYTDASGSSVISVGGGTGTHVAFIDGYYVVFSTNVTPTWNTTPIYFGKNPKRLTYKINHWNNSLRFITNINETLYFAGGEFTGTTDNVNIDRGLYKLSELNPLFSDNSTNRPIQSMIRLPYDLRSDDPYGFGGNQTGTPQIIDGLQPIFARNGATYSRGMALYRLQPTVFSLYSVEDTVYN